MYADERSSREGNTDNSGEKRGELLKWYIGMGKSRNEGLIFARNTTGEKPGYKDTNTVNG